MIETTIIDRCRFCQGTGFVDGYVSSTEDDFLLPFGGQELCKPCNGSGKEAHLTTVNEKPNPFYPQRSDFRDLEKPVFVGAIIWALFMELMAAIATPNIFTAQGTTVPMDLIFYISVFLLPSGFIVKVLMNYVKRVWSISWKMT